MRRKRAAGAKESKYFMSVMIGIDTGGTFTDAVAFDDERGVAAKAKALTTRRDLSLGIGAAIDAVMAEARVAPGDITLVSMSTTLATNAIVEGQGGRICLVMIGFSEADLDKAGLRQAAAGDEVIFLNGGHDAHGAETAPLNTAPLAARLRQGLPGVTGFAVAGHFAVRNPSHEKAVADLIRAEAGMPATCSHELSARLGGPRRALTTVLNARLIGLIQHLIAATETLLAERGIEAPLMVVRGDGALISSTVASEKPIETILSGPAASVVGAAWLTDCKEAIISDIGGTTTDVAVLRNGRPAIDPEGARVGGWRTMVEAVAMHTVGLGGDSEVRLDESALDRHLTLGPRRVMPVSLLAVDHAALVHEALDRQLTAEPPPDDAGRFAISTLRHGATTDGFTPDELALLSTIADGPAPLDRLLGGRSRASALRRMVARGDAAIAGFCPSDAAHVLGMHKAWDREAAEKCATLFARRRTGRGSAAAANAGEISRAVIATLTNISSETLLEVGFQEDGYGAAGLGAHELAQAAMNRRSGLIEMTLRFRQPIIGLGASAPVYYPAIAERLGSEAVIPDHADVANAVGAVVGRIRVVKTALISSPSAGIYRLHLDEIPRDFADLNEAVAVAESTLGEQATEEARRNGADDIRLSHQREDKTATVEGSLMFMESRLSASASGRPRFAH